jgi:hypothetical protein
MEDRRRMNMVEDRNDFVYLNQIHHLANFCVSAGFC